MSKEGARVEKKCEKRRESREGVLLDERVRVEKKCE